MYSHLDAALIELGSTGKISLGTWMALDALAQRLLAPYRPRFA